MNILCRPWKTAVSITSTVDGRETTTVPPTGIIRTPDLRCWSANMEQVINYFNLYFNWAFLIGLFFFSPILFPKCFTSVSVNLAPVGGFGPALFGQLPKRSFICLCFAMEIWMGSWTLQSISGPFFRVFGNSSCL